MKQKLKKKIEKNESWQTHLTWAGGPRRTKVNLVGVLKGHRCSTHFIDHTCSQGFAPSCYTTLLLSSTVQESINFYQEDSNQIKAVSEKTPHVSRWASSACLFVDSQTASMKSNTSAEQRKNSFLHLLYCWLCWGEERDWLLKTSALLCFSNVTHCDAKLAECEIASREKTQSPPSRVKFPLSIHFTVSSPKTAGGVILPHNCGINSIFCWWRRQSSLVLNDDTDSLDFS